MRAQLRVAAAATAAVLACLKPLAPSQGQGPSAQKYVAEGDRHYFKGKPELALEAYQRALRVDGRSKLAWLNGAVVWAELGASKNAAEWYRQATQLDPKDAAARVALGELESRLGKLPDARAEFAKALEQNPDDVWALTGLGKTELIDGNPKAALAPLARASRLDPDFTLAYFYLGKAREEAGDDVGAIEAYKGAAFGDSYFTQARYHLSRSFVRMGHFHEAWEQITHLTNIAPLNRHFRRLQRSVAPHLRDSPRPAPIRAAPAAGAGEFRRGPHPFVPPPKGEVPLMRIGIATNGMGRPLGWRDFQFESRSDFQIIGAKSGKVYGAGKAKEKWSVHVMGGGFSEVRDALGKKILRTRLPVLIRPKLAEGGWTTIKEIRGPAGGRPPLGRALRGEIEVEPLPGGKALKMTNTLDIESYTQGVLTAEMPITSPVEALKAQAVLARSHALFMQQYRRRHKDDGYNLCDGQHCQAYYGVGSETQRSRDIVRDTRGRVVTHEGRVSDVLYSSNCGGHTQAAGDIKGWNAVPYFMATPDAPASVSLPHSPWSLRQWLRSKPKTFCAPSKFVYPSHYRWTRVVSAVDLDERLHNSLRIGRVRRIVPLERAASGHLNAIRVEGTEGTRVIRSEMSIRGLFGVGSQRSALFVFDTEEGRDGMPNNFIFYGGGWGHGVGMCQSGAMGRAQRGQSYIDILQAYLKGVEIGHLRY